MRCLFVLIRYDFFHTNTSGRDPAVYDEPYIMQIHSLRIEETDMQVDIYQE